MLIWIIIFLFLNSLVSLYQFALPKQWKVRRAIREEQLHVWLREWLHRETLWNW